MTSNLDSSYVLEISSYLSKQTLFASKFVFLFASLIHAEPLALFLLPCEYTGPYFYKPHFYKQRHAEIG